eukprot:NODE_1253_length_1006_cov_288.328109_g964_i0.p1 GENE.NODE_1253_length_1006_cov_288.328109_g964_i0~~NODE_1253_length_1006_cov_288.328109_g964_i0.p1  ORF type:complete len:276 (-),score=82.18 NODE_1253_length_1006_cov_288.328109_g964_i0:178-951(-)
MSQAAEFKDKGNQAFKAGKYQDAVKWYSQAIQVDPRNETLYSNRAATYSALDKHPEALADAEKCIQLKPEWVKGHFRQGVALFKMGKYDLATASYKKSLEIDPNNEDIQNKFNEARALMKKQADNMAPNRIRDPEECKKIGNTQFKEGKYEEAIGWYSRAIELTESNPTDETAVYFTNRAACHAQGHSFKQVISDTSQALAINPKNTKAYLRRAMACEALEKWQKAVDDYKKVMELEPGAQAATEGYRRAQKYAREL